MIHSRLFSAAALGTLLALLAGCPTATPDPSDPNAVQGANPPPVSVHDPNSPGGGPAGPGAPAGPGGPAGPGDPTNPGDPIDPNNPQPPAEPPSSSMRGTFSGEATWQVATGLASGSPSPAAPEVTGLTVAFDDSGVITAVFFPGYLDAPDGVAAVRQVGDEQTLTPDIYTTQTVRMLESEYTASGATLKFRVEHDRRCEADDGDCGPVGNKTEAGHGTQTVRVTLSGDTLTYEAEMSYEVELGATTLDTTFPTIANYTTSAVLTRD